MVTHIVQATQHGTIFSSHFKQGTVTCLPQEVFTRCCTMRQLRNTSHYQYSSITCNSGPRHFLLHTQCTLYYLQHFIIGTNVSASLTGSFNIFFCSWGQILLKRNEDIFLTSFSMYLPSWV